MINIKEKKECMGCHACFNICPKKCITMEQDDEGFLYPIVDSSKCINCNLCEKVCPVLNPPDDYNLVISCATKNKDLSVRINSSSGGIFTLLAEEIIKKGGIVFGAAFDEKFNVVHIGVDNVDELYRLRGSKYVQSKIGEAYKEAKKFLETGRIVYFSGTPCQVSGLRSFLKKSYENLICQDIICHGVPSPYIFDEYTKKMKSKYGDIINISFRDKTFGWRDFSLLYNFLNDKYLCKVHQETYMRGFLSNIYLRPSCYDCKFKGFYRKADITLADFWGIENVIPEFSDDKGVSLILINSEKGNILFESILDRIDLKIVDRKESMKYNSAALKSCTLNLKRKDFFECVKKYGVDYGLKKFCKISIREKYFTNIKKYLKKIVKKTFKI